MTKRQNVYKLKQELLGVRLKLKGIDSFFEKLGGEENTVVYLNSTLGGCGILSGDNWLPEKRRIVNIAKIAYEKKIKKIKYQLKNLENR